MTYNHNYTGILRRLSMSASFSADSSALVTVLFPCEITFPFLKMVKVALGSLIFTKTAGYVL